MRFTCASSQRVTEEQVDEESTNFEPKVIAKGRLGETEGEGPGGSSNEDIIDDDRYWTVYEESIISTSGGGMSIGVHVSSGSAESKPKIRERWTHCA